MKYAVIKILNTQFKVSEGDKIKVPKIKFAEKKKIQIKDVLLLSDNGTIKIGHPALVNVHVEATVLSPAKGSKLRVFKYKAKSRYRKAKGHRSELTLLKIDKIITK